MNRGLNPTFVNFLRHRAELLRQLRLFFDRRGFLEVQPPCLSRDVIVDAFIDPVEVHSSQFGLSAQLPSNYYLQTSPEAAMKRMLSAGAPSIYSIGPVFRSGESGDHHNVEFTMLEWYDVGATMDSGIELLGELATSLLNRQRYDVRNYRDLFREQLGVDPLETSLSSLVAEVAKVDRQLARSVHADRDALLDVLLSQRIAPSLGSPNPVIVKNYPLSQAALARRSEDDSQCAARFELFVDGIELANGYDELRDPDVLMQRLEACNQKRLSSGRNPLPTEIALVDAMRRGLPQCAGVALGVDRFLMIRTGESTLSNVIAFSIESA